MIVKTDSDNGYVFRYDVSLRLKKLRDTEKDNNLQSVCALHESGHFVMYAKLYGKMPEKLVSRTADKGTGGFLLRDYDKNCVNSKEDLLKDIQVSLGGYVAEKMIFGNEGRSSGAGSDLKHATCLASMMIRENGMGSEPFVSTRLVESTNSDPDGYFIRDDSQSNVNEEIKAILYEAEEKVRQTFENEEWYNMLKESAKYLCEHTSMPKEKMQEIYDKVSDDVKMTQRSDSFYREIIYGM
jgi:cell division protease FtsH